MSHIFRTNYVLNTTLAILISSSILLFSSSAEAVPAFARQTSSECSACHFQHFPKLKAFGRHFKANGFSMTSQNLLEGDRLSIPAVLNASFFIKSRISETSRAGVTTHAGHEFPNEAALLVGGRLSDGVGGLVELASDILSYKVSFTRQLDSGMSYGATTFATDGLGAAYGFELMNTGAVRNIRPFERASKASIGGNSGSGVDLSGAATGVALHAANSQWFTSLTLFTPDSAVAGISEMDAGGALATYFRAAYMPNLGGMDAGIGVGVFSGDVDLTCANATNCVVGNKTQFVTEAMFVDAQLQGDIGGKELGLYFMYTQGDDQASAGDVINLFNGGTNGQAPSSWGLDMEYSMTPSVHILANVGRTDNGDPTLDPITGVGVGLYWQIKQNISLQPMFESFDGDATSAQSTIENRWTMHLETAF